MAKKKTDEKAEGESVKAEGESVKTEGESGRVGEEESAPAADNKPQTTNDKPQTTNDKPPRRFKVTHPTMVNGHIMGLIIRDGQCITQDAKKAHAAQEAGCTVVDADSGEAAWAK